MSVKPSESINYFNPPKNPQLNENKGDNAPISSKRAKILQFSQGPVVGVHNLGVEALNTQSRRGEGYVGELLSPPPLGPRIGVPRHGAVKPMSRSVTAIPFSKSAQKPQIHVGRSTSTGNIPSSPFTAIVRSASGDLCHDIKTHLFYSDATLELALEKNPSLHEPVARGETLFNLQGYLDEMKEEIDQYLERREKSHRDRLINQKTEGENPQQRETISSGDLVHELRSPLTAIQQELLILAHANSDEERDESIARLSEAYNHLDDVLTKDIKNVDEIALKLDNKVFSIEEVFNRVASITKNADPNVRVIFECENRDVLRNLKFKGDYLKICKILINLLSNAIKYTTKSPQGKVLLKVLWSSSGNTFTFRFIVRDFGNGIPQKFQNALFQKFSKGEKAVNATQTASSGLGLYLSQKFANIMGSEIQFLTKADIGTAFHFTVNLQKVGKKQPQPQLQPPIPQPSSARNNKNLPKFSRELNLAVFEDVELLRKQIRILFSNAGAQHVDTPETQLEAGKIARLTLASSGAEAVKVNEEFGPFDVVMTDMHMPIPGVANPPTGLDVARFFLETAYKTKTLAPEIILCTGDNPDDLEDELEDLRQEGQLFEERSITICTKPFNPSRMVDLINGFMEKRSQV